MRNKIIMVVLSIALVVSLVLVGCTKPEPAPGPTPTPTPTPAPTPTPTPAPEEEKVTLIFQDNNPLGPFHDTSEYFTQMVNEISGGTLVLNTHFGGELVPNMEILDAVRTGALDLGICPGVWYYTTEPAWAFSATFPFCLDPWQLLLWYNQWGGKELIQKSYDKHNVYMLNMHVQGAETLCSKNPIRSLDDFKGVKIRAAGTSALFFEKIGAEPMTVVGPDIYTSLERGVVDAYEFGGAGYNAAMGLDEVTNYYIMPCWHGQNNGYNLLINKDTWSKLSTYHKNVLEVAGEAWALHTSMVFEKIDAETMNYNIEQGIMEVIMLPDEDVERARVLAEELNEEMADKSPLAREVWESIKRFREIYGEQNKNYKAVRP
jgi:TRAP-type mannitol/chloroaromatic compound transport system substrate-binding protein